MASHLLGHSGATTIVRIGRRRVCQQDSADFSCRRTMSRAATRETREPGVIFLFVVNAAPAVAVVAAVAAVLVVAVGLVAALVFVTAPVARPVVVVILALLVVAPAAVVTGGVIRAPHLLLVHLAADQRPAQCADA